MYYFLFTKETKNYVSLSEMKNVMAYGFQSVHTCTVNSRLADTPLLRTLAIITDKIQIPIFRGLTENDSRYYGLLLFRTQNQVLNTRYNYGQNSDPHL